MYMYAADVKNSWHFQDKNSSGRCADLESFFKGGPNLITFFLVDKGIEDPNTAINGPSSARQRNPI